MVFGFPSTEKGEGAGGSVNDVTYGGGFGTGLRGGYSMAVAAGPLSVGVGPNLGLGLVFDDRKVSGSRGGQSVNSEPLNKVYFELFLGVDLGIKFKSDEKFTLYTGASLQVIDWQTAGNYGGDSVHSPNDKDSAWVFNGFQWQNAKWTGTNNLGFGLTYTPVQNVVVGFGLNAWLDRLFTVNLATMEFKAGSVWSQNFNNAGSWFGNLLFGGGVTFDLTLAIKF